MKKLSLLKKQEISKAEMNILSGGSTDGCDYWCDIVIGTSTVGGKVCNVDNPFDAAIAIANLYHDIDYSSINCREYR